MIYFKRILFLILSALFLASVGLQASLADTFVVDSIQFEGLQHLQQSTVLSYLPVSVGQLVDDQDTSDILRALYATGFFDDVNLERKNDTLIIIVKERPVIEEVNITGNKEIDSKKLKPILSKIGVSQGEIYDPSKLNMIKQGLMEQYRELGYYSVDISTQAITLPRNRVKIQIEINEGVIAKIHKITFVGNKVFSEHTLRKQMSLKEKGLLTWIGHKDRYSSTKLDNDLRNLAFFYYDHGYMDFKVLSNHVTMLNNNKEVDITILVDEGQVYKVSGTRLVGSNDPDLLKLITIKPGDTFSRQKILDINKKLTAYYTNHGHALATINTLPQKNSDTHQVFVIFQIDPGPMVYVRHIRFTGNNITSDTVLRSYILQMEGAPYSQDNIDESKRRLANLPYLKDVSVTSARVSNVPDEIDLNYHLTEVNAGKIMAQVGYSDTDGFLYGAGMNEPNFLGTGKDVGLNFQNSQYQKTYNFNYTNPYYTTSGISRSFNLFYTITTPNPDLNQSSYREKKGGGTLMYGLPITRHDRINVGGGYSYISLSDINKNTAASIVEFLDDHPSPYNQFNGYVSWLHATLDRAIFPTKGYYQTLGGDLGVPVLDSSLSYYKLTFNNRYYYPLGYGFVINPHMQLGYGNGYGDLDGEYPFFENFYAGGISSVPGFAPNSLGPKNNHNSSEALGGNLLTVAGLNFVFPNFVSDRLRTSIALTAGNVYDTNKLASNKIEYEDFSLDNMRTSAGLMVEWYSPFGPLEFDIATPLNKKPGDKTQLFDFAIGTSI